MSRNPSPGRKLQLGTLIHFYRIYIYIYFRIYLRLIYKSATFTRLTGDVVKLRCISDVPELRKCKQSLDRLRLSFALFQTDKNDFYLVGR